jgi:hypothetical protein
VYYRRDEEKAGRPRMDSLGHPRIFDDITLRNLRRAVIDRELVIRSTWLLDQMARLQFFAPGEEPGVNDRARDEKLKIRLPGGGSPDLVMALAYAWLGVSEVVHFTPPKPRFVPEDSWSLKLDGDGWDKPENDRRSRRRR